VAGFSATLRLGAASVPATWKQHKEFASRRKGVHCIFKVEKSVVFCEGSQDLNLLLKALCAIKLRNSKTEIIALETATLLQERIRSAKSNTSPVIDISSMDRSLAQVVKQPITQRGFAEEIFADDEKRNEADFLFRQVKGGQEVADLTNTLKAQTGPKDRWPFDVWLDRANDKGWTIIEVRREGEDLPAGFTVIGTDLRRKDRIVADGPSTVVLNVDLNSVYVTPSKRGGGYSQALSWAIGKQVEHIVRTLARSPATSCHLGDQVKILIEGEAHSEGGPKFLGGTVERIEANVHSMNLEQAWFDLPTVIDDVDTEKFSRLAKLRS
jgi:hypothetical protein